MCALLTFVNVFGAKTNPIHSKRNFRYLYNKNKPNLISVFDTNRGHRTNRQKVVAHKRRYVFRRISKVTLVFGQINKINRKVTHLKLPL